MLTLLRLALSLILKLHHRKSYKHLLSKNKGPNLQNLHGALCIIAKLY